MNRKLPILIAATMGLFILATNISVNSVIARSTPENDYGGTGYGGYGAMPYGYGGMGHGGPGPVIQEPVNTGNHDLDKAINKFYSCLSHTHEDPPTVKKTDCYYQTVSSNGGTQT